VAESSFIYYAHKPFLGTRKIQLDEKPGDFVWKTYADIYKQTRQLGSGLIHLNLAPAKNEYKDFNLSLIGVFCKNREE